ncbi:MAG TPA: M12 family metallo-peptidase, partial [Bacteroidia bacterium]|nr:M12 family metallo-peptidase [Bacteroidia bacterium]
MKKFRLTFSAVLMLAAITSSVAQTGESITLGDVKDFAQNLTSKNYQARQSLSMPVSSTKSIDYKIIEDQSEGQEVKVYGEVLNVKTSIFYIYGNSSEIKGKIVIDSKDGYEISTNPQTKQVELKSVDVNTLICVMPATASTGKQPAQTNQETGVQRTTAQAAFSSLPGADFVLYLDFDGEYVNDSYWNSQMGGALQCHGPNYSDAKAKQIWAGVAEKYRPFNVNVTTDRAVFDGKSKALRHMVVYTDSWGSGGGIADIGSIANNGTDICWVFFDNLVADVNDMVVTGSHESGHAFGLQHDGSTNDGNYYKGQGNWGPIMGNNYQTANRDIWQWSKGEYNGATAHGGAPNVQDDVSIIAGNPSVGYRKDEDANTTATAVAIVPETDGTVLAAKNNGVITTRTDKDYFKIKCGAGTITLKIQSSDKIWTADEAVLDIQARLLDENGTELQLSNPTASGGSYGVDASISKSVAAGTYYLEIDGVGYLDPKTTGYSDYASIGYFEISGSYPVVTTGISQPTVGSNFSVYPNPANDRLFVSFSDAAAKANTLR